MIRRATPDDLDAILDIRRIVFIEGQNVPEHEERDGKDADALHLIAFHDDAPVGTARLLLQDGTGKIGRVAVLDAARGLGLGKALMEEAATVLREEGAAKAILAAQTHAIGFYEALGYVAYGDEFMDAGIPHRNMSKRL
ncbi:MAG: GNAT family N-acetyltransferase [Paracoccaceae bacterium]|nr:GNAT family N-acetyltransferase [Paracoccaceae bacterium]